MVDNTITLDFKPLEMVIGCSKGSNQEQAFPVELHFLQIGAVKAQQQQDARFKDSAESETSRPSRIRLGPLRDESESRVGRLNSEETDSAENWG